MIIYILELENKKYYIGKTNDFARRFKEHLSGKGSEWTKKYKPIKTLNIIENASSYDEDKYTKEMMFKYGIDNVRGGTYITTYLSKNQREFIKRELWSTNNMCLRCGRNNHFVKNCYTFRDIDGRYINDNITKKLKEEIKSGRLENTEIEDNARSPIEHEENKIEEEMLSNQQTTNMCADTYNIDIDENGQASQYEHMTEQIKDKNRYYILVICSICCIIGLATILISGTCYAKG